MDPLFRPAGDWQRLPAVAVTSHRLNAALANLIVIAISVAAAWVISAGSVWAIVAAAASSAAWTLWRVIRAGRWVRAFSYQEGERKLLISQGLWNQSLTAIPYGRMLSVQVTTGPISRLWGLAGVQLVTASHLSRAQIPSLPAAEAARLRDELIARGEEQALPL